MLSKGKGALLLFSRLWVPSSRLRVGLQWPMSTTVSDEDFGDGLCHKTWNLTVSY